MNNAVEERPRLSVHRLNWLLLYMDEVERAGPSQEMHVEDFMLGRFDEEYLSADPPESDRHIPVGDWSDWFPPPPGLTNEDLDVLTGWVEAEADKRSLWADPDQYPQSIFEQGEFEWLFLA